MLTMTQRGSQVVASLFKGHSDIYCAIGKMPNGQSEWVSPPPDDVTALSLLNEIGRRRITSSNYVVEDPLGLIGVDNKYYTVTLSPTNLVYLKFSFDAGNAANERVLQIGIFTEVTKKVAVPQGQNYLIPSEIENAGNLFFIMNIAPVVVDPLRKFTVDAVIRF